MAGGISPSCEVPGAEKKPDRSNADGLSVRYKEGYIEGYRDGDFPFDPVIGFPIYPDTRISGYLEIQVSGYPIFLISENSEDRCLPTC